jgi:indolepyruvate decarboxylase
MADGYARVNGFAAFVTTYGVGELSAFNGIAGAYAEHVPVLHIVGTPSTDTQRRGLRVHHGLGDGDHEHFLRAYREVTCAAATLTEANAAAEIDRVLAAVLTEKRPGYLALPSDLVRRPCPIPPRPGPAESLLAAAVLLGGKGAIDESYERFAGVYAGALSESAARRAVENADVIIGAGLAWDDLNSGGFTAPIDDAKLIDIQPDHASVGAVDICGLTMAQALDELYRLVEPPAVDRGATDEQPGEWLGERPSTDGAADARETQALLSQDVLWQRIGAFLRPGDILAVDQGTPLFGAARLRLPTGTEVIAQPSWASIGYTLPAVGGAQLATTPRRRSILVIGDGAAQMTVQELGTLAREGLDPIVIVVNNSGYTIERAIGDATAFYNDIPAWNWQLIPAALGTGATVSSAATVGQLDAALASTAADSGRIRFIKVLLDRDDVPAMLGSLARALAERAAG